jgi:hypothetical protein
VRIADDSCTSPARHSAFSTPGQAITGISSLDQAIDEVGLGGAGQGLARALPRRACGAAVFVVGVVEHAVEQYGRLRGKRVHHDPVLVARHLRLADIDGMGAERPDVSPDEHRSQQRLVAEEAA